MALVGRGRKRFSAASIPVLIGPPSSWGWLLVEMLPESLAFLPLDPSAEHPERFYPSCAENPAVQGGDVERGERSSPKLNSVSAAARCTGG